MYCSKCGKQLNDNANFCIYCGNKIGGNVQSNSNAPKNSTNFDADEAKQIMNVLKSFTSVWFHWGIFIVIVLMVFLGNIINTDIDKSYFYWSGDGVPKAVKVNNIFDAKELNEFVQEEIMDDYEDEFKNSDYYDYKDSSYYKEYLELKEDFTKCKISLIFAFITLIVGVIISFCALFSKYRTFEINRIGYIVITVGMMLLVFWLDGMNDFMGSLVNGTIEYSTAGGFKTVIILCIINVIIGVLYQKIGDVKKYRVTQEPPQGMWRCSDCNNVNPNYVGVCKCGKQKNS